MQGVRQPLRRHRGTPRGNGRVEAFAQEPQPVRALLRLDAPGGAEVEVAVLFADIRGSTALGEQAQTSDYAELLNRFYATATDVLLRHDALIDKLIGDEAMALFIPGVAGPDDRRKAVSAAIDLLHAVGYGSAGGPWLAVGIGVNAGRAYVGNVGSAGIDSTCSRGSRPPS